MSRVLVSTMLSLALLAGRPLAGACTLAQVHIGPLTTENGGTYRGEAAGVEVLFHNDVQDHPVTAFPEPPMTVRRRQPPTECAVTDGGVWGRDGVWLTADGRTLVTTESSGSYEGVVFRDTGTCAKVGEVDVSGVAWRVDGAVLVLASAGPGQRAKRVRLDGACRPVATRDKGATVRALKPVAGHTAGG